MAHTHYEGQCGKCYGDLRADGGCDYCEMVKKHYVGDANYASFKVTATPFWRRAESYAIILGNGTKTVVSVNHPETGKAAVSWGQTLTGATPEQTMEFAALITEATKIAAAWNEQGFPEDEK